MRELTRRLGVDELGLSTLDQWDTRVSQPVVYTAGLLALRRAGVHARDVAATVGHSMGELTAATFAGALDPEAGLDVVCARADLGYRVQELRPGAMAVVFTATGPCLDDLLSRARVGGGELGVAVVNGPSQLVVSGDEAAVGRFVELAEPVGVTARRLPIGGPYHSALLAEAVPAYRQRLVAAVTGAPRCPLVASTNTEVLRTAAEVVETLAWSLVRVVDWPQALHTLHALGVEGVVDAGPGSTLVRLQKACDTLPVVALSPDGVE